MTNACNSGVAVDVRVGEELLLELDPALELQLGPIVVRVEKKDGQRARLRVVADKRIMVSRPQSRTPAKAG